MRRITTAAALIIALGSTPLWAQTAAEHDAHHPAVNAPAAPAQPLPPAAQAQPSPTDPGQNSGQMHSSCCTMTPGASMPGIMHRQMQDMMKGGDMPAMRHGPAEGASHE